MHKVMPAISPAASSRPIEVLPPPTQSKLRSTQILTSLPQIVSELVQNSLDAGACQIDVGVDCEEWECWVRDDGVGMNKDGLAKLARGSRDGRYNTSKAYTPASLDEVTTFGFRGEGLTSLYVALVSAADVACIEVSSRTARSRQGWSIILKGGKCLYDGPSLRWRRESHGTVVSIRDAFYNLPIRRRSHHNPSKTIDLIRRDMETFALVSPNVSFTLEETRKAKAGYTHRTPSRILSIPKTGSTVSTFRHLYGRALAEHVDEIHEIHGDLRIDGFISLEGAHSKSYQFLNLNRHPLTSCDMHRVIDVRFSASSFSKHAFDEHGATSQPRSTVRRSPRRTEKKPIYVLNITVPPRQVDNCLEPSKASVHLQNLATVTSFLSSVIQSFLVRHGFAVQPSRRSADSSKRSYSPSPRKRRKLDPHAVSSSQRTPKARLPVIHESRPSTPVIVYQDNDGLNRVASAVWTDPYTSIRYIIDKRTGNSYPLEEPHDDIGTETDAETQAGGDAVRRAGSSTRRTISIPKVNRNATMEEDTPQWIHNALVANRAYTLTEPKIPSLPASSFNLPGSHTTPRTSGCNTHHSCSQRSGRWHDITSLPWDMSSISDTRLSRFGKEDLKTARVLGQVDRKFVACVLDIRAGGEREDVGAKEDDGDLKGDSSGILVLFDQHAADERIRVERFLKELCSGFLQYDPISSSRPDPVDIAEELDPPVPVLLTRQEAAQIVQSEEIKGVFKRWGIGFVDLEKVKLNDDVEDGGPDNLDIMRRWRGVSAEETEKGSGYTQVMVRSVPALLCEKLLMNDELRDVIKGMLVHIETVGYPGTRIHNSPQPPPSSPQDNSGDGMPVVWHRALRWCPKQLLDLVNSKACRGAIMFNDTLTLDQCQRLVQQLANTAAPFQCAHGRPSLAPLASIGSVVGRSDSRGRAGKLRKEYSEGSRKLGAVDWGKFGVE